MASSHFYTVIMCGGSGPRLWPLSRETTPKPFLNLIGPQTPFQSAIKRAISTTKPSNTYIITNIKYANIIKDQLLKINHPIPLENIIYEPRKRNTLSAILYFTSIIEKLDPQAIITSAPADHQISNLIEYKKNIAKARTHASKDKIALFGIKPKDPDVSYGYAIVGRNFSIKKFIEKPDYLTCQFLIKDPKCFWNSGIYTFSTKTILNEIKLHQPEYYQLYLDYFKSSLSFKGLKTAYSKIPNLSIDIAISQKSTNLRIVPATFTWTDIGEWQTIYAFLKTKNKKHVALNHTQIIDSMSKDCLVYSHKPVALLDVHDLSIVNIPDSLLICQTKESYQVRDLVKKITDNPQTIKYFTQKSSWK